MNVALLLAGISARFVSRAENEILECARCANPLALLMLAVDHYRPVPFCAQGRTICSPIEVAEIITRFALGLPDSPDGQPGIEKSSVFWLADYSPV